MESDSTQTKTNVCSVLATNPESTQKNKETQKKRDVFRTRHMQSDHAGAVQTHFSQFNPGPETAPEKVKIARENPHKNIKK